jgi:hypothetical protein
MLGLFVVPKLSYLVMHIGTGVTLFSKKKIRQLCSFYLERRQTIDHKYARTETVDNGQSVSSQLSPTNAQKRHC